MELYIKEQGQWIDRELDRLLPPAATHPARLHEAMRYVVQAGGKRLRPLLCLETVKALGGGHDAAIKPALALELFHTYTLVHDDLPCMDDDDLRRGRPTCHIAYDEAHAVLTGDALLTLAFEWMSEGSAPVACVQELARSGGSQGVVGGQVEDMRAEKLPPDAETLEYIHAHKTAALIRASVRVGALSAGADAATLDALTRYGNAIGHAFQIADDILDATASTETLGKPAGSDEKNQKATYVNLYGLEESRRRARSLLEIALDALHPVPSPDVLAGLARYLVERNF